MRVLFIAVVSLLLNACAVTQLPQNLSRSIMNQEDPELVEAGAPAYLLLLDALILTYPDNKNFLMSGAQLYGAFAGVFANTDEQAKLLADKAMGYAERALCVHQRSDCDLRTQSLEQLEQRLDETLNEEDIKVLYSFASAWAGWLQANADDWSAIAQLAKVKALLYRIETYDASYDNGTLQVYLGVLETQIPPSLGGKPDIGKDHFEKALELTDGQHLMAKVLYAKQYGRLMFEQELHDRLLQEALDADPVYDNLTLINRLAQKQAAELLASSAEYFE